MALGLVDHFFRREYGRLVAQLTRAFGAHRFELVEDAVQSALEAAIAPWAQAGPPADPSAWLYRVAHRRMLDALRRSAVRDRTDASTSVDDEAEPAADADTPRFAGEVHDDMLRMLFICCDEGLPRESRVVLALKVLCGFGTREIALRLFTTEANVNKRLGRAREWLRERAVDLDTPPVEALRDRLGTVHEVIYLLFNEGYHSAQPDQVVRRELCEEAIRLGMLLAEHPVGAVPETFALLALMCLHASRLDARVDEFGGLLLLADQDRSRWDRGLIRSGGHWLERAAAGDSFSRFHIEAAIAAAHAFAPSFAETPWQDVADYYATLERIAPSPIHTMNRAVAIAEAHGPAAGLSLLEGVVPPAWLSGYYLWDSVLGELHRRAGNVEIARRHLERARAGAPTEAEQRLIQSRLARVT